MCKQTDGAISSIHQETGGQAQATSAVPTTVPRSNRTARKRPETAVVIRQTRNVYKNGVKRWSFRSKNRPETAVVIRTDGLR
jgi:hypothetical protein